MAGDHYDQSLRVSTYGSMFAFLLNEVKPEDVALAGLFYHVGLARCPEEILKKPESELTNEERAIFYRHPEDSVTMVKEKKVVLMPNTADAILQHHERLDGQGFPKQLRSQKIAPEAVLLKLADDFDQRTTLSAGKKRMSAEQALDEMGGAISGEGDIARRIKRAIQKMGQGSDKSN
jgi:response regulator RpfG family c-di-GMP phosphodiesterase